MNAAVEIPTDKGTFIATFSSRGLRQLEFPTSAAPSHGASFSDTVSLSAEQQHWFEQTRMALEDALAGRLPRILPPLDWSGHTEFRQKVWQAMLRIKPGETRSYGDLGNELGQPLASRAVGGACGANPIPVLVPCHRVLAAHGRLGGFSGGLDWKRRLLAIEGIVTK